MRGISRDDSGVSMVFIAFLLVALIGFAGLAVDVGALYAEKTELQKGAEAAVLAIAQDCAHGTKPCDVPTATATAEEFIDANARDLAGAVDSISLDLAAQEVTVVDRTERRDGGGVFLPYFAQVIGFEGTTVRAQAKARWGMLSSLSSIPLTMSTCDVYDGENLKTGTITVTFHDPSDESCDGHPGFDGGESEVMPAGFGTLVEIEDCVAYTEAYDTPTANMWAFQNSGSDFSEVRDCLEQDETYLVPIFVDFMKRTDANCDAINPQPTHCYGIGGYAAFTVTAWRFPSDTVGDPGCGPPESCLTGEIKGYSVDGEIGDSFDFGVVVVDLTG